MMRTIVGTVLALSTLVPGMAQAQTEQVFYYHTDAIGSVRMITDETGQVVARYDYLPFGETCGSACGTPSAADKRQFAGKERDQGSGFDYFGARYYASGSGRFPTIDPMLDVENALVDPQQWNRYAYARNNPLRYVDPMGAAIELLGDEDERERELELPRRGVGNTAGSRLYINNVKDGDTTRYFVGINGNVGDFMKLGESAHTLANLVSEKGVVEFGLTQQDLSYWGGSRTIESGKEGNGNTRVLVNPVQVPAALQNYYGLSRFEPGRTMRAVTPSIASWHEFGHAWGLLHGRQMVDTGQESIDWENIMRQMVYGPFGPQNARRRLH